MFYPSAGILSSITTASKHPDGQSLGGHVDAPDVGTVWFSVSCTTRPGGQAELDFRGSAAAELRTNSDGVTRRRNQGQTCAGIRTETRLRVYSVTQMPYTYYLSGDNGQKDLFFPPIEPDTQAHWPLLKRPLEGWKGSGRDSLGLN